MSTRRRRRGSLLEVADPEALLKEARAEKRRRLATAQVAPPAAPPAAPQAASQPAQQVGGVDPTGGAVQIDPASAQANPAGGAVQHDPASVQADPAGGTMQIDPPNVQTNPAVQLDPASVYVDPSEGTMQVDPPSAQTDPTGGAVQHDPASVQPDPAGGAMQVDPPSSNMQVDPAHGAVQTDPAAGTVQSDPAGTQVGPAGGNIQADPIGAQVDPAGSNNQVDPSLGAVQIDPTGAQIDPVGSNNQVDPATGTVQIDPAIGTVQNDPTVGAVSVVRTSHVATGGKILPRGSVSPTADPSQQIRSARKPSAGVNVGRVQGKPWGSPPPQRSPPSQRSPTSEQGETSQEYDSDTSSSTEHGQEVLAKATSWVGVDFHGEDAILQIVLDVKSCEDGFRTRLGYRASLFLSDSNGSDQYIGYIQSWRLSKRSALQPNVNSELWVQEWLNPPLDEIPDNGNSMAKTLRALYEKEDPNKDIARPSSELALKHDFQLRDNTGNEIVYIASIQIKPAYSRQNLAALSLQLYYQLLLSPTLPSWYGFNGDVTFLLMPGLIMSDAVIKEWRKRFPEARTDDDDDDLAGMVAHYLISWYERNGYEVYLRDVNTDEGIIRAIMGLEHSRTHPEDEHVLLGGPGMDYSGVPDAPSEHDTSPYIRGTSSSGNGGTGSQSPGASSSPHHPGPPKPRDKGKNLKAPNPFRLFPSGSIPGDDDDNDDDDDEEAYAKIFVNDDDESSDSNPESDGDDENSDYDPVFEDSDEDDSEQVQGVEVPPEFWTDTKPYISPASRPHE